MNSDIEKRMDEWFRVHRIFSDDDGSPQIQSNEEEEDLDDVADSLDEWFIRNEPSQKLKETEEMDYEETVIQENNGTTVIPSQCAGCGKKAVGIKYEVPHCADCQVVPFEEYETDGSLQYDRSVGTEGASHEAGDPLPIMAEQYEPAPVNPNLPNFMPGLSLCIVCGGNAIGIKFGVLSCKGCEDFFRRMHTYQLSCLKESKCDIKFKTKRRCPYCYLQKCRLMGMSFDGFTDDNTNSILRRKNAVNRLTDVRLAEKKQRNDREIIEVLDKGFLNNLLRLGPICNHPKIQKITDIHQSTCHYTDMKSKCMRPNKIINSAGSRALLWQIHMEQIEKDLISTIPFLNSIMENLDSWERMILWKKNVFSVYMLRCAKGFESNGFNFQDGRRLDSESVRIIYSELAEEVKRMSKEIQKLAMTDGEIGMLIALILTQPIECKVFKSHVALSEYEQEYSELLYRRLLDRNDGLSMIVRVKQFIPRLNEFNSKHVILLDYLRKNASLFKFPPVFSKIFEIRKSN